MYYFPKAPVPFWTLWRVESRFLIMSKFLCIRDQFHWLQKVNTMQFSFGSDSVKLHLRKMALVPSMLVNMFSQREAFTSHPRVPYCYGLQLVRNLSSKAVFTCKLTFDLPYFVLNIPLLITKFI